jgi:hypothetical protein
MKCFRFRPATSAPSLRRGLSKVAGRRFLPASDRDGTLVGSPTGTRSPSPPGYTSGDLSETTGTSFTNALSDSI